MNDIYLSVIIPAFNEEGVIENNVNKIADYLLNLLDKKTFEIIIIDDGSSDGTSVIIDKMAVGKEHLKIIHHKRNFGRGRALQSGFFSSRGEYVITLDADLSYSTDHIEKILKPLEHGAADIVLASAYHPKGSVRDVPFNRALISRIGNKILTYAVGGELRTVTCVVRGYTRTVIDSLILFGDGKDIHLEIIQKARILGFRILEVPANLQWLPAKRSNTKKGMSLKDLFNMSSRHLFFNFLFRPSSLFMIPISVLGIFIIILSVQIATGFIWMLNQASDVVGWQGLYNILREHIIWAKISYATFGLSLVLLIQFISLLLMSKQSQYHYDEMLRYFSYLERIIKGGEEKKETKD